NDSRRSTARRLFVLVCPSAVICKGLTTKKIGFCLGCRWVIDHYQQHLAAITGRRTAIIVPLVKRRVDAIPCEDKLGIYRHPRTLSRCRRHKIIPKLKALRLALRGSYRKTCRGINLDSDEPNILEIAFAVAGLNSCGLQFRSDIVSRLFAPRRTGAAALKLVGGEYLYPFFQLGSVEQ